MDRKFLKPLTVCLCVVGLVVGLVLVNIWLERKAAYIAKNPINASAIKPLQRPPVDVPQTVASSKATAEILKQTRLAPERTFEISVFYQDSREIARHKVADGVVYDQTGTIPDGKVKFINETDESYGVEYYRDGVRHGPAKASYKDGQAKQEAYYQYGKLITNREYYIDGIVRMEQDFSDARNYNDRRDTGVGKVYFRDGKLKYQWRLTNSDPVGFQKSYNRNGEMTSALYFDQFGQAMDPQQIPAAGAPAPETP